ncbi:hypothetical protein LV780_03790 [Cereibacter azotoformans]|uniref:Uncharacterized protein n=1 Tax=Cereibacter azotoformans TaxID=43057 RepID=A0A2T5JX02_9RHOB|nr:hypothetical protein [Cereibacter azotoformans]AXQ93008.1 hypothetical protein D0Z66_03775 [Cereibacter sphaeroides]MBO4169302.1 hypothetical protein [Cereibacter azotoformans]PTR14598.1 hypothetical protein C8J28_11670 [Cereibacter azotoformans]UIJ31310.1 hypothetical protein LV780_03790 [Cereibacter azotoformans]
MGDIVRPNFRGARPDCERPSSEGAGAVVASIRSFLLWAPPTLDPHSVALDILMMETTSRDRAKAKAAALEAWQDAVAKFRATADARHLDAETADRLFAQWRALVAVAGAAERARRQAAFLHEEEERRRRLDSFSRILAADLERTIRGLEGGIHG